VHAFTTAGAGGADTRLDLVSHHVCQFLLRFQAEGVSPVCAIVVDDLDGSPGVLIDINPPELPQELNLLAPCGVVRRLVFFVLLLALCGPVGKKVDKRRNGHLHGGV